MVVKLLVINDFIVIKKMITLMMKFLVLFHLNVHIMAIWVISMKLIILMTLFDLVLV